MTVQQAINLKLKGKKIEEDLLTSIRESKVFQLMTPRQRLFMQAGEVSWLYNLTNILSYEELCQKDLDEVFGKDHPTVAALKKRFDYNEMSRFVKNNISLDTVFEKETIGGERKLAFDL